MKKNYEILPIDVCTQISSYFRTHQIRYLTTILLILSNFHGWGQIAGSCIVSTVAGIGIAGYSGDGGPASAAQISGPNAAAFDNAGNLYISDFNNHRIRKIDTSGIITTIAGTGTAGYSGDGGPATAAEINAVYSITTYGSDVYIRAHRLIV